jgi:hypothetical protein
LNEYQCRTGNGTPARAPFIRASARVTGAAENK